MLYYYEKQRFFENQEVEVMYDASETSVDTHFRIEMAKEERCRRHQMCSQPSRDAVRYIVMVNAERCRRHQICVAIHPEMPLGTL